MALPSDQPTVIKPLAPNRITIAISSRVLFDLSDSHNVFEEFGLDAYRSFQVDNENEPLSPGDAFPLVQKLLRLNQDHDESLVDIVLLSRNSADTGLRIFNSIEHYGLNILRAAFCGGASPYRYISAFGAQLFLSSHDEDVRQALAAGYASARIVESNPATEDDDILRIAFDGDSVIFSDEAERVYKTEGLEAFSRSEKAFAHEPLMGGPFKQFLSSLHQLQSLYPKDCCPIRTSLVTARSAPSHERVIRTLRSWGVRLDESLFLGGLPKGEFLKSFGADIFFDDQETHCRSASEHVATGHVPHGIANDVV